MDGKLSKVELFAFEDKTYGTEIGKFSLPINPEQFSQSFKVEYDLEQEQGSQGTDPDFRFTGPEELQLDFVFDGTGVIPKSDGKGEFYKDVVAQVRDFVELTYTMNPKTHKPNFLRLIWGDFSFNTKNGFDCILKDLAINYTLFSPKGVPLRAKLRATFVNFIEQERRIREQGKESPDLTHYRKVVEGDHLSLMTHKIYGDPSYYLQVAKVNKLINFRRLNTKQDLRFPPIRENSLLNE